MPPGREAPSPTPAAAAAPGSAAARAVDAARELVGTPYRNGGTDPEGFDCSGFVQYVFAQVGVPLPRSVREQWQAGEPVEPDAVQAGDLVFFAIDGQGVSHVGIVTGTDAFVHAPSSRGAVRLERLAAPYWSARYAGARRVTGG